MIDWVVIQLNTINIWCEHGFSLSTMVEVMNTMKWVKDGSTEKDSVWQDNHNLNINSESFLSALYAPLSSL